MTRLTYHPLFLALYPFLFIYSNNLDEYPLFSDLYVPLALTFIACAVVFFAAYALSRDRDKATLVVSLCLFLFFSYGHVLQGLRDSSVDFLKEVQHQELLAAYGLFFCFALFLIYWVKNGLREVNVLLDVVSAALVVFCILTVVSFDFGGSPLERAESAPSVDIIPLSGVDKPPDIYFIILDSYGSPSTMKDVLGYDNGEFISHLKSEGFYVPSKSRSNYAITFLSLCSSLNLEHITFLKDQLGESSKSRTVPYQMLNDNAVARSLKAIGYKFVNIYPGWEGLGPNPNADWNIDCNGDNELTAVLQRTTVLSAFESGIFGEYLKGKVTGCTKRVNFLRCMFSKVPEVQHRIKGPRFVFVPIPIPHLPYIFGPNGEERCTDLRIADEMPNPKAYDKKTAYLDQFVYTTKMTSEIVDRILSESDTPPVIIIQSDHGVRLEQVLPLPRNPNPSLMNSIIDHRMRIFSAYYMPGNGTKGLHDTMSPVNNFRVIFNAYFNTTLPLLTDDSYYSRYYYRPYIFTNATKLVYTSRRLSW